MKVKIFFFLSLILVLSGLLLSSGCLMTRADVEQAENDKKMADQVSLLQKDKADQVSQLSDVNEQIRQMSGRIEVLENQLSVALHEKKRIEETSDKALSDRDLKLAILQEAITKQETQLTMIQAELASKGSKKNEDPKQKKSTNAFVVAETLFKQKEWKEAILNYQKYSERTPNGRFAPDATYKIGVCFQELGMNEEAKTFYDDVILKFPASEAAKAARARLKKIK